MPNLKQDLLNKVSNEKYLVEIELVRLSQDPNMNYRDKIDEMIQCLADIAIANAQMGLLEQYFGEPQAQPAATGAPVANNGQTHAE